MTPAGSPDGCANPELARPRRRPDEHQVGQVDGGDEQHARDSAEQEHHPRSHGAS